MCLCEWMGACNFHQLYDDNSLVHGGPTMAPRDLTTAGIPEPSSLLSIKHLGSRSGNLDCD